MARVVAAGSTTLPVRAPDRSRGVRSNPYGTPVVSECIPTSLAGKSTKMAFLILDSQLTGWTACARHSDSKTMAYYILVVRFLDANSEHQQDHDRTG
jgi:hypothetical protein